ncbi:hypothetical protein BGZ76_010891 [Entomortierella beljakovae]|nr:hypothetical protein BGZ76_010891 [Entomortierella beljakovae]
MDPHQLRPTEYQQFNKDNKKNGDNIYKITAPAAAVNRGAIRDRQPNSHQFFARRQSTDRSFSSPSSLSPFSRSTPDSASVSLMSSSPSTQPPLPPRKNSAVYENAQLISLASSSISPESSDLKQNCLLFPTYAKRRKDSKDWDIRIRGWAYSQRANRRRRIAMSVARKIAGITKDHEIYETLESRFGMFLNNNTQGARFNIQCTGATSATHMELAGDAESDDPIESIPEFGSSAVDEAEIAQEKAEFRVSLEQDPNELRKALSSEPSSPVAARFQSIAAAAVSAERSKAKEHHFESVTIQQTVKCEMEEELRFDEESKYSLHPEILLSNLVPPESESSSWRFSKSTSLLRVFTRSKPTGNSSSNYVNESDNSLQVPPSLSRSLSGSNSSTSMPMTASMSSISTSSTAKPPLVTTQNRDIGNRNYPTIEALSQPGGHFSGEIDMTYDQVQQFKNEHVKNGGTAVSGDHPKFLKLRAYHHDMTEPARGIVNLIGPEGISVISDIDDTIKDTNVTAGARTVLRNTFLRKMEEVEGMAHAYKKWGDQDAAFHYVSNSPWQLIPTLLDFFHTHSFPPGSAHLRTHENNVLKTYFMTPGESKKRSIREIMRDFPERKFILVGDSGEIDLEIYTDIAVAFPKQVFRIFIRDVTAHRSKEPLNTSPVRGRTYPFGRRGSSAALTENTSTPNLSTVSSSTYEGEKDAEAGGDFPIASTPDEFTAEEIATLAPKSGVIQAGATEGNLSLQSAELTHTANSTRSPRSPSAIRSAGSFLSSAFRRSSSNNSRKKQGANSPYLSPSNLENPSGEYPFPATESSSTISQQINTPGTTSNFSSEIEGSEEDEAYQVLDDSKNIPSDMTSGQGNLTQKENQQTERGFSSSSIECVSSTTKNTSAHSSPMLTSRPARNGNISNRENSSTTSLTTLTPSTPQINTAKGFATVSTSSSSVSSNSPTSPVSDSPSPFSASPSANASFSIIKSPADSWNDRVIQCKKRLPEGVLLSVFESAEELEQCPVVQERFARYNNNSQDKIPNRLPTSASNLSGATIVGPNGDSSLSNVKCIDKQSASKVEQVGHPIAV